MKISFPSSAEFAIWLRKKREFDVRPRARNFRLGRYENQNPNASRMKPEQIYDIHSAENSAKPTKNDL